MFDHRRIITGLMAIRSFFSVRSSRITAAAILLGLFTAAPVPALKVYRTKSEGLADVKVYETSSEGLADCLIYVTHSESLASGDAKWYFETSEGLADVKVYFTDSGGLANKKIYFTKSEGLARCEVEWKGYKKTMAVRFCENEAQPFANSLIREMVMPLCSHDEFQLGESR